MKSTLTNLVKLLAAVAVIALIAIGLRTEALKAQESACYATNNYICVTRCTPQAGCNSICESKQYASCDDDDDGGPH